MTELTKFSELTELPIKGKTGRKTQPRDGKAAPRNSANPINLINPIQKTSAIDGINKINEITERLTEGKP